MGVVTNFAKNPRFATGTSGVFVNSGGSFSRITDDGVTGSGSLEITGSLTYAGIVFSTAAGIAYPGDGPITVSFSRKLISGASNWRCFIIYLRADASSIPGPPLAIGNHTPTSSWTRTSLTFTAAPAEPASYLALQMVRGSDVAGTMRLTDILVEKGSVASPYFDGDSLNAVWTGTPHASTSILTLPDSVSPLMSVGTSYIGPLRLGKR